MKRLPDTELEVMKALWASGPDTPRAALDHALADFQWSPNTINTYLNRLADPLDLTHRRQAQRQRKTPRVYLEHDLHMDSRVELCGRPGQGRAGAEGPGGPAGPAGRAERG